MGHDIPARGTAPGNNRKIISSPERAIQKLINQKMMNDINVPDDVTPLQGLNNVSVPVPGVSPRAGMFFPFRVK